MRVQVQAVTPEQVEADVVAVPLSGDDKVAGAASVLDSKLDGLLARLAGEGELRGESGHVSIVHVDGKLGAQRVAVAGLGPPRAPRRGRPAHGRRGRRTRDR